MTLRGPPVDPPWRPRIGPETAEPLPEVPPALAAVRRNRKNSAEVLP